MFMNQLLSFNDQFDEYVAERDDYDYQDIKNDNFIFFNRFNFTLNEDLEDLSYNFMSVILGHCASPLDYESFFDTIFFLYKNYLLLKLPDDISFDTDDRKIDIINKCKRGDEKSTRSRNSFRKKNIFIARVGVAMLVAFLQQRPYGAFRLEPNKFFKLIKIMADWKEFFVTYCPRIYHIYFTEFILRSYSGKRLAISKKSKGLNKSVELNRKRLSRTRKSSQRSSKRLRKI